MGHLALPHSVSISEVYPSLLTLPSFRTESGPKDSTTNFRIFVYVAPVTHGHIPCGEVSGDLIYTNSDQKKFPVFINSMTRCMWQTNMQLFRFNVVKTVTEFCGYNRKRVSVSKIQLTSFLTMVILLCYYLLSLLVEISTQHIPCM